jgi:hypothetical protein
MKTAAGLMIVLALLIGIVPQFTSCESRGRHLALADGREIPMKCHWTGQAEVALAVPLVAAGLSLARARRKETLRMVSAIGAVLGLFVILLPTTLVGVCANPDMICNSIMRPSLILMGGLVVVLGLSGVFQSMSSKEEALWEPSGLPGKTS